MVPLRSCEFSVDDSMAVKQLQLKEHEIHAGRRA